MKIDFKKEPPLFKISDTHYAATWLLSHKTYGHSNVYQAAVSKEEYTDSYMHGVLNSFFGGSVSRLVNYFSSRNSISVQETDEILQILNDDKK